MIKRVLIIIGFLSAFLISPVISQYNYYEAVNNQLRFKDTNLAFINYSRNQILGYIEKGQFYEAKMQAYILDMNFSNTEYLTFYPVERWLLSYWTGEYDYILKQSRNFETKSNENKIYPPVDLFSSFILTYSVKRKDTLINMLNATKLLKEETDFLKLVLNFLFYDEEKGDISQEFLNNQSDLFIETYPGSVYENFIRSKIRYKLNPTDFDFGFCFYSGYSINMGQLNNCFKSTAPIVLSFDFNNNKIFSSVQFQLGVTSLVKKQFDYKGIWPKDMKVNYYQPGILIGYEVFDNEKVEVKPFICPSLRGYIPSFNRTDYKKEYAGLTIEPRFTYTAGVNFDFSLMRESAVIRDKEVYSNWYARVQLGICYPTLYKLNKQFSGAVTYILIGISTNRKVLKKEF